jgi:hypothetical protein
MPRMLEGLRREHLEAYLVAVGELGDAPATIGIVFRAVRPFRRWLVEEYEIERSPGSGCGHRRCRSIPRLCCRTRSTPDDRQLLTKVEIAESEAGQLAPANAGVQQQRDHRQVSPGDEVRPAAGGQHRRRLLEDPAGSGRRRPSCRIALDGSGRSAYSAVARRSLEHLVIRPVFTLAGATSDRRFLRAFCLMRALAFSASCPHHPRSHARDPSATSLAPNKRFHRSPPGASSSGSTSPVTYLRARQNS